MGRKITIKGKIVHDVGYRPFLLGIAESLEIERFFADNLCVNGMQAVEVLVDTDKDKLNLFTETVERKYPENAVVDEVEVEDYEGKVMKTESYYRYLTATQLSRIATYGGKMLNKQDETNSIIGEESQKTRETVSKESQKTRVELKGTLERGFDGLKSEHIKTRDQSEV